MIKAAFILLLTVVTSKPMVFGRSLAVKPMMDTIPSMVKGNFIDDYGIRYNISDSLWTQLPHVKYHIISWNSKDKYLLARNDDDNPSDPGLFTRIDYMSFTGMAPFLWGFCLTTYNAATLAEAETKGKANRALPKKGCNGYPFSRMKRTD